MGKGSRKKDFFTKGKKVPSKHNMRNFLQKRVTYIERLVWTKLISYGIMMKNKAFIFSCKAHQDTGKPSFVMNDLNMQRLRRSCIWKYF
ncbi:hypothetical protein C6W24_14525 [Bacillus atrophaeus]|nr:hypothetical protein C6W24_14525 [Bacillus atrophaeus]